MQWLALHIVFFVYTARIYIKCAREARETGSAALLTRYRGNVSAPVPSVSSCMRNYSSRAKWSAAVVATTAFKAIAYRGAAGFLANNPGAVQPGEMALFQTLLQIPAGCAVVEGGLALLPYVPADAYLLAHFAIVVVVSVAGVAVIAGAAAAYKYLSRYFGQQAPQWWLTTFRWWLAALPISAFIMGALAVLKHLLARYAYGAPGYKVGIQLAHLLFVAMELVFSGLNLLVNSIMLIMYYTWW